jgi:D-glycero-alpha-D-manno-heptose 1-phosphate guanylyltransferase
MKTIILAGGMGTRLSSVVTDVPKPMAPVGGKPFLEYVILSLAAQGLKEIILSVGYKKETIQSYFEDGSRWKVKIVYSEEDAPLGTGGALREALKIADETNCLILNGDTFNSLNFQDMVDFHTSRDSLMTIALAYKRNVQRYGSVKTNDSGEITGFLEKNEHGSGYINRGAYVASGVILAHMPVGPFSLENDLFHKLIGLGFFGFITHGLFTDIGIPSTYSYINDHAYVLEQTERVPAAIEMQ